MRRFIVCGLVVTVLLAAVTACGGESTTPIKIGVVTDCVGFYAGEEAPTYAGAELALIARGATIAGKKVELIRGCGDDTPKTMLSEVRRLVEQDGVNIVVGPLQTGESFVVREYARMHPDTTFVSGSAANQGVTLHDPAPNFYRFSIDGAQAVAGLGAYAYWKLGWRRAVVVGATGGFEDTQIAGFVAEFCSLGGTIVNRVWTKQDLARYVKRGRVDGFFLEDAVDPTSQLANLHGSLGRRVLSSFLWFLYPNLARRADGVVLGLPTPAAPDEGPPSWRLYLAAFRKTFPALVSVSTDPFGGYGPLDYYDATQAVVLALDHVHGDLSGGERRFQAALAGVRFDSPTGPVRLDRNHTAIGTTYLDRFEKGPGGKPVLHTLRSVAGVDQTFGGYFHTNGPLPSLTYPPCRRGHPPPWARRSRWIGASG